MTNLPLDASGSRHSFFNEEGVDQLVSITLELATELWVVRERLYALENVAEQHNFPVRGAIEAFEPSAAQQEELAAMRSRMITEIFRTLGRDHRATTAPSNRNSKS